MNTPTKDEMVSHLHKQIDETSRKVDELKLKSHLAKAEVKTSMEETINKLDHQQGKLKNAMNHLAFCSESAWDELAEGCQRSWKEFKDAVENAVEKFKS